MHYGADGWQPVAPLNFFWAERRSRDTRYLHLDYSPRDEAAVREIAPQLDALLLRLHNDLGLPPPSSERRIEIAIAIVEGSDVRVTDLRYSGNTLIISPPEMIPRPLGISNGETLRQMIAYALAAKTFSTARSAYPVPCHWRTVGEGISLWLRWEDHTLPSRRHWEYQSVRRVWSRSNNLPALDNLLTPSLNCAAPPPIFEVEILNSGGPLPRNELAATLIEYMVATYGRDFLPTLLRDLKTYTSWNDLAQKTVNLSADELEAGWHAYLTAQ
jgi:hypothetical protein